jgi:hypothetical protein
VPVDGGIANTPIMEVVSQTVRRVAGMDFGQIKKAAKSQGWTVDPTNGGHVRFTSPTGERYFTAGSPSDVAGTRNLLADLRGMGLIYPFKKNGKPSGRKAGTPRGRPTDRRRHRR